MLALSECWINKLINFRDVITPPYQQRFPQLQPHKRTFPPNKITIQLQLTHLSEYLSAQQNKVTRL